LSTIQSELQTLRDSTSHQKRRVNEMIRSLLTDLGNNLTHNPVLKLYYYYFTTNYTTTSIIRPSFYVMIQTFLNLHFHVYTKNNLKCINQLLRFYYVSSCSKNDLLNESAC
jgi:hypothetical protein